MNIFEGSRRIAKAIAGIWLVGMALGAINGAFSNDIYRSAMIGLGGLAFIWVFTWVVGWIVRGFRGIPRGQDSKPNTPAESK